MNKKEKFEALMTVARAYLDREVAIQYDQRAMDRNIQLTQRRAKSLPPEAATEEYTLFLDCSSYMFTLYREAFGLEFPSDLTWHMIDLLKPRVYFYVISGEESTEDKERIKKEIKKTLEPGDVITYDRHSGSGHTMLYIGDGKYTHCTTNFSRPNSYDYENKKSREYETGLWIDEVDKMLTERIFNEKNNVRRIAISRPLDTDIMPTEQTVARMTSVRGLKFSVTSSHNKGNTANVGDEIEYTLHIFAKEKSDLSIDFTPQDGAILISENQAQLCIGAGERKNMIFKVKITESAKEKAVLDGPRVTVNGFKVFTHSTPLGKMLTETEVKKLNADIEKEIPESKDTFSAVKRAYNALGISLLETETDYFRNLFFMYDSTSGDILYRKPQNPKEDGSVYSLFGGIGVTTPENSAYPFIRTNKARSTDLAPGDIILVCDDPYGIATYSSYYTGNELIGKFESTDDTASVKSGEQVAEYIDSLLGRFAFLIIRPALTR